MRLLHQTPWNKGRPLRVKLRRRVQKTTFSPSMRRTRTTPRPSKIIHLKMLRLHCCSLLSRMLQMILLRHLSFLALLPRHVSRPHTTLRSLLPAPRRLRNARCLRHLFSAISKSRRLYSALRQDHRLACIAQRPACIVHLRAYPRICCLGRSCLNLYNAPSHRAGFTRLPAPRFRHRYCSAHLRVAIHHLLPPTFAFAMHLHQSCSVPAGCRLLCRRRLLLRGSLLQGLLTMIEKTPLQ